MRLCEIAFFISESISNMIGYFSAADRFPVLNMSRSVSKVRLAILDLFVLTAPIFTRVDGFEVELPEDGRGLFPGMSITC